MKTNTFLVELEDKTINLNTVVPELKTYLRDSGVMSDVYLEQTDKDDKDSDYDLIVEIFQNDDAEYELINCLEENDIVASIFSLDDIELDYSSNDSPNDNENFA